MTDEDEDCGRRGRRVGGIGSCLSIPHGSSPAGRFDPKKPQASYYDGRASSVLACGVERQTRPLQKHYPSKLMVSRANG